MGRRVVEWQRVVVSTCSWAGMGEVDSASLEQRMGSRPETTGRLRRCKGKASVEERCRDGRAVQRSRKEHNGGSSQHNPVVGRYDSTAQRSTLQLGGGRMA